MKTTTLFLFLMCLCIESFGAVIVIRGQPLPLNYINGLYYLPQTFTIKPGTKNLYITMDGLNKVCFLNTAPPGLFQQKSWISIIVNGVKMDWNCFPYETTVTEARP